MLAPPLVFICHEGIVMVSSRKLMITFFSAVLIVTYICIVGVRVYLAIDGGCVYQYPTLTVYINISKISYLDVGYINLYNSTHYRTKMLICKIIIF
jgi:hypothetical protein